MCRGAEGTEGCIGLHIGKRCIGKGCIGAHRLAAAAQKETYGHRGGANFEGEHSSKTQLRQPRSH